MKKWNKCLLAALIIALLYLVYSLFYWGQAAGVEDGAQALGASIATVMVMSHLVCTLIASIFNVLGMLLNRRAFALTAGILYAVAMVLFPMYFFFVVVEMIICFIAFARMKTSV